MNLAWPAGRPRVLVTDGWLTNAGDAAIALATQQLIKRLIPDAAVLHAAYGADVVGDRYPQLTFVPTLDALVGTAWQRPSAADGLAFVEQADLVLSQGGGFLREAYQPWARISALARVVECRPLLLLGQTIGRFDLAFARRDLASVLAEATVVTRDQASVHHAIDLGADPRRVVWGTDVALALVGPASSPVGEDAPVGVVLSDHVANHGLAPRHELAADLLQEVVDTYPDRRIEVWSSAQGVGLESDGETGARSVALLPAAERERVHHVAAHVDAHELVHRTATSAAVISMRLHPALLASAQGTPSLLVLDDQKAGALDRSPLARRVVRSADRADLRRALGQLGHPLRRLDAAAELGELVDRRRRTEQVLATTLDGLTP